MCLERVFRLPSQTGWLFLVALACLLPITQIAAGILYRDICAGSWLVVWHLCAGSVLLCGLLLEMLYSALLRFPLDKHHVSPELDTVRRCSAMAYPVLLVLFQILIAVGVGIGIYYSSDNECDEVFDTYTVCVLYIQLVGMILGPGYCCVSHLWFRHGDSFNDSTHDKNLKYFNRLTSQSEPDIRLSEIGAVRPGRSMSAQTDMSYPVYEPPSTTRPVMRVFEGPPSLPPNDSRMQYFTQNLYNFRGRLPVASNMEYSRPTMDPQMRGVEPPVMAARTLPAVPPPLPRLNSTRLSQESYDGMRPTVPRASRDYVNAWDDQSELRRGSSQSQEQNSVQSDHSRSFSNYEDSTV